jgi:phosphoserine phosphatase
LFFVHEAQILAVGDGANDLAMLGASGLGIAFCAKPKVQKEAQCRLNSGNLLDVLYFLGFSQKGIQGLLNASLSLQ